MSRPDVLDRMPLAKRRLAERGPVDVGSRGAMRDTVLIIAAELRLQDVPEEAAVKVCLAIPFDVRETPRRLERSVRDFVRWAYNPPDGLPVLTGCPRAPHHSGDTGTSRLRSRFEPYCDDACARTCRVRRATDFPAQLLPDSPFAPVYFSSLWMRGAGLGLGAKDVYERLAALALAGPDPEEPVRASRRYLAAKLGHIIPHQSIGDALQQMRAHGLITLINKRYGLYRVHALPEEQVKELEEKLGTRAAVAERQRDAQRQSLSYLEWLDEWDEADDLIAGTGPIEHEANRRSVGNLPYSANNSWPTMAGSGNGGERGRPRCPGDRDDQDRV